MALFEEGRMNDFRFITNTELEHVIDILRDYEMHEPRCPARQTEKAQHGTDVYFTPQKCLCWLSNLS